tara:strand:+ start:84 stop:671 length:588 start_codon:yes stop_codon:yes gene_type:complete
MANLITTEDYKLAEGITTPKEDARIDSLVISVSELVKTYCNTSFVDFYSSNKTETFTTDGIINVVMLKECPVYAIVSVSERTTIGGSYTALTVNSEYYLDTVTDGIYRTNGSTAFKPFAKGPGAVQVIYKGGYSSTPEDLKLAVIDLITYYLKDEHKERRTIAGASIQNPGSTSQRNNVAFPDHIKRVLDLYKNY